MSRYLAEMKGRGIELAESLFPRHQSAVVADLKSLGKAGWQAWLSDNLLNCLDYLQATPASRKKKKWTSDTQNHRRLILGALVFHRVAVRFQEIWERHGECTDLGYRDAHRAAAHDGWNAMVTMKNLSIFPLDFLDELLYQADGVYEEDVAWVSHRAASEASFEGSASISFEGILRGNFKFGKG